MTYSAVVGAFIGDITKDIIVDLGFTSDGRGVVQSWLIILVIMLEVLLSRTARVLRHVEGAKLIDQQTTKGLKRGRGGEEGRESGMWRR